MSNDQLSQYNDRLQSLYDQLFSWSESMADFHDLRSTSHALRPTFAIQRPNSEPLRPTLLLGRIYDRLSRSTLDIARPMTNFRYTTTEFRAFTTNSSPGVNTRPYFTIYARHRMSYDQLLLYNDRIQSLYDQLFSVLEFLPILNAKRLRIRNLPIRSLFYLLK